MKLATFHPPKPQLWKEEIAFAQQAIAALPAGSTVVEIGSAQGGGLHLMASARQWPSQIAIHSFDPYPGDGLKAVCDFHAQVYSHACFSEDGSGNWASLSGESVDLLVIDGSHTLTAVCNDFNSWRRWLSPGGKVLIHDYDSRQRDGASHPAVQIFGDALIRIFGGGSKINHVGRYLMLGLAVTEEVKLDVLKETAVAWIGRALKGASRLKHDIENKSFTLERAISGHSRVSPAKINPIDGEGGGYTDTEIVLFLASEMSSLREELMQLRADPLHVIKWIEFVEMFLHARGWSPTGRGKKGIDFILGAISACKSIADLSRLCADIAVLIGLVESALKTEKSPT